jgi:hypothetical protein
MGKGIYRFFVVFGVCPAFLGGVVLYQSWNFGDDSAFLAAMMILFGMVICVVGLLVRYDARH